MRSLFVVGFSLLFLIVSADLYWAYKHPTGVETPKSERVDYNKYWAW
jgi:hypothetical protein